MSLDSAEVVEAGVDWITTTATHRNSARKLYAHGMRLVQLEKHAGNEQRLWSFKGYEGFICGGVQTGTRSDGAICILTSGFANDHWSNTYEKADNVSRLDLQVTVRSSHEPRQVVSRALKQASRKWEKQQGGPRVRVMRELKGGSTLYLGKPKSIQFGRIYDKAEESRLAHYKGCVRFERVTKDDLALHLCAALFASSDRGSLICAEVAHYFEKRGVSCRWPYYQSNFIKVRSPASTCERKLEWLSRQVAPCVAWLISQGLEIEVRNALKLSASATSNLRRLKRVS